MDILQIVLIILVATGLVLQFVFKAKNNDNSNLNEQLNLVNQNLDRILKDQKDEFRSNREETSKISSENRKELNESLNSLKENIQQTLNTLGNQAQQNAESNRDHLAKNMQYFNEQLRENIKGMNDLQREKFTELEKRQEKLVLATEKRLDEMRATVEEKLHDTLEKRLGESFKQVSERLEQVHKGLGEMQNIATGVGDLKKVLSNVKTRGVLGEYQLENILEQLLTPDQYAKNVATKKGSQAHVEFAIQLPGKDSDDVVWMPVDSKFPIENYQLLLDAFEEGDKDKIESAQKALIRSVESFAKDISDKYIDPPHTTNFGIMFLPIEGLYAEILRHPGLFENLQRKYRITITGPTTLSALLNSLQMGFRTLAVQKRSSEVWKILEAVKTEFGKFEDQLDKVDKQLNTASKSLENLRSTRTNQITRKLKDVSTLDTFESSNILGLEEKAASEVDENA